MVRALGRASAWDRYIVPYLHSRPMHFQPLRPARDSLPARTMPSPSLFLSLPCELRYIIYQYYVLEDDGYHVHYESGKIRASNNRLINLSLMYTCRSVATEMRGVALGTNTLTFSTGYSDNERIKAGRFGALIARLHGIKSDLLDWARPRITHELTTKVAHKFPQYLPVLERLKARRFMDDEETAFNCWGNAGSVHRAFVDYTFECLSMHTSFNTVLADAPGTENGINVPNVLTCLNPAPWSLPSAEEVAEMYKLSGIDMEDEYKDYVYKRFEYRFSAAASAILFLQNLSHSTRCQIRYISLCEDRVSVASPECHVLGLIPFCLENPRLHIERRVNLWRNAFPAGSTLPICSIVRCASEGPRPWNQDFDRLRASDVSKSLGVWIMEALALPSAGMPANSFSLVFDGDPISGLSSQVFEIVKRDAAWQLALDQWYTQKSLAPSFFEIRDNKIISSTRSRKLSGIWLKGSHSSAATSLLMTYIMRSKSSTRTVSVLL